MFDIRKIQERVIFNAVMNAGGEEAANDVVYGTGSEALEDPVWVKTVMKRLEGRFDRETVKHIRMNCQCGYGMDEKLALVQGFMEGAHSMEQFANSDSAQAAGLFCENGELFLQFPYCPCPMLEKVDRLDSDTWCQCTTGYSKVLFEKAFGCEVQVELLQSVKMGHERCLMKIMPQAPVW